MNIWIVDDYVAFAYKLKDEIRALARFLPLKPLKIEVTHDGVGFFKLLEDKDPERKPDLIFLDIQMPGQNGLEIYLKLVQENHPVVPKIHFCSAVGFGYFTRFFEERGLPLPPFVSKSQVLSKLETILVQYIPGEKRPKKDPGKSRESASLKHALKEAKMLYYETGITPTNLAPFQKSIQMIFDAAHQLGKENLVKTTQKLLHAIGQQKKFNLMGIRKEIKDVFRSRDIEEEDDG